MVSLTYQAVKTEKPVIEDTSAGSGRLDVASDEAELELWDSRFMLRGDHDPEPSFQHARWGPRGWCKPSCIPISIILILIVLVVLLPLLDHQPDEKPTTGFIPQVTHCTNSCRFSLVESIPIGLKYPKGSTQHPTTHQTWMDLINMAENSIEIASFYWTLQQTEVYPDPSSRQGEEVFQGLLEAGTKRNISIFIAQNSPTESNPNVDTEFLAKQGAAQVRSVNFTHLMGGGVLHTKLWLIDRTHLYVGSANMDWRSLTQVKELGAVVYNCSCLAADMGKLFDVYWMLGMQGAEIPGHWPDNLSTQFNSLLPMNVSLNDTESHTYIASSPPPFCPEGRSTDLSAILDVITKAEQFIYVAVMDYFPLTIYTKPVKWQLFNNTHEKGLSRIIGAVAFYRTDIMILFLEEHVLLVNYVFWEGNRLWQEIDNALRSAAIDRRVRVQLLVSQWNHTRHSMTYFLQSLQDLSGSYDGVEIEVKCFTVPSSPAQAKIPFARVNHNKYMVTDKTAYIGTSNWSGDYFIQTGGIGLVISEPTANKTESASIRSQLQAVFERDWKSEYARPISTPR